MPSTVEFYKVSQSTLDQSLTGHVFVKYAKRCDVVHWDQQGNSKWRNEAAGGFSWYCKEVQMWGWRYTERLCDGWLLKLLCDQSFFVQFGRSSYERSDSDVSDDAEGINTDVKHYEWRRHDGRYTKKTLVGVSKNEELVLLNQQIKILKKLIYVKKCQVKHYNKILNQTK